MEGIQPEALGVLSDVKTKRKGNILGVKSVLKGVKLPTTRAK